MFRKLLAVAVVVVVAVHTTSAAPRIPLPINDIVNGALDSILNTMTEPVKLDNPLEIRLEQENVAHVYLKLENCEITGLKDFGAHDSTAELYDGAGKANFTVSIKSPRVTLISPHYFINGTMVDHVELFGEGPAMIYVEDMDVNVKGTAVIKNLALEEFTAAVLDLEMWRWTVDLENLMPGTDLGTVFNEFFSMYGPELFDIMENNINKSGNLLIFLNNLIKQYRQ